MIPELTDDNVELLATAFLDTNVLLPMPVTLTTFVGYAFPTDTEHPEPWGKRAGQLRRKINAWIEDRMEQTKEVTSKRRKLTRTWSDPLKVAALKAKAPRHLADVRMTKEFVKDYVHSKLKY